MKISHKLANLAIVAVAVSALAVSGTVRGAEKGSAQPQPGSILSMAWFYSGSSGRIGNYPGNLVCLRCDLKPGPGAMAQCKKEGHRHALSMDSDGMIHPLLAGTDQVLNQINSGQLHDKQVVVHGTYYPSTGAILVDRITEKK
jgi:hypothetical protein